jgi:hypothetical protein
MHPMNPLIFSKVVENIIGKKQWNIEIESIKKLPFGS